MNALLDAIAGHASERPGALALSGDSQVLDYADLQMAIDSTAAQLEGKVLGLFLDNCPDWLILDLAAQKANICCVPLPLFFSASQIHHVIENAGIDVIITDRPERLASVCDVIDRKSITVTENTLHVLHLRVHNLAVPANCDKVSFTSGTSGHPRGVRLDNEQMIDVAQSMLKASNATRKDRILSLLPLSTLLENIATYAALLCGASVCLPSSSLSGVGIAELDMERMCSCFSLYRPSMVVLVPQLLRAIVVAVTSGWKAPVSLRFIAVGGASVAPVVLRDAMSCGLPVYEGYGLSEACSVVSLNRPGEFKTGSVGRVLPHAKIRIAGDGEIEVAGSVFKGYLGELAQSRDEYLPTGDLGYIDDDGYLFLHGRKKNLIITAYGRNFSPEWAECEITAHPAIRHAVVFGDGRPFNVAIIFAAPGVGLTYINQIIKQANERLPVYAHIKRFHLAEQPCTPMNGELTSNGRPRRAVIADHYASQINAMYEENSHVVLQSVTG